MISHEHKCIFIHIPKTAGTSINSFFYPEIGFHYEIADYDRLFGWCPKRKLHMQHATSKELLETGLISQNIWNSYFKFTFVRNPWDRAHSDYRWIQKFSGISGTFREYITSSGVFKEILNDNSENNYLGDHLHNQTGFFDFEGVLRPNFIGRFENFDNDIKFILKTLNISKPFDLHENKGKNNSHYSKFYTNSNKRLVDKKFNEDITQLDYYFEDKRFGLSSIKKIL